MKNKLSIIVPTSGLPLLLACYGIIFLIFSVVTGVLIGRIGIKYKIIELYYIGDMYTFLAAIALAIFIFSKISEITQQKNHHKKVSKRMDQIREEHKTQAAITHIKLSKAEANHANQDLKLSNIDGSVKTIKSNNVELSTNLKNVETKIDHTHILLSNLEIFISKNDEEILSIANSIFSLDEKSIKCISDINLSLNQLNISLDLIQDSLGIPYTRDIAVQLYKAGFTFKYDYDWSKKDVELYLKIVLPGITYNITKLASENKIIKHGKTSNSKYSSHSTYFFAIKEMISKGLLPPSADITSIKRALNKLSKELIKKYKIVENK